MKNSVNMHVWQQCNNVHIRNRVQWQASWAIYCGIQYGVGHKFAAVFVVFYLVQLHFFSHWENRHNFNQISLTIFVC